MISFLFSYYIKSIRIKSNRNILLPVYYEYIAWVEQRLNENTSDLFSILDKQFLKNAPHSILLYVINDQTNEVVYQQENTQSTLNINEFIKNKAVLLSSPANFSTIDYQQKKDHYLFFIKKYKTAQNDYLILFAKNMNEISRSQNLYFIIILITFFCLIFSLLLYLNSKLTIRELNQKIQKQIEKEYHLFQDLISNNPHSLMMLIDIHYKIQKITDAFENFVLYNSNEILNKDIAMLMPEFHEILHYFSSSRNKNLELELNCKNNTMKIVAITLVPYYNLEGKIEKYLIIFNDLTEIKKKNEQLAKELTTTRTFSRISQLISNATDPYLIVKTIVDESKNLITYNHGTLFLVNGEELNAYYSNNPDIVSNISNVKLRIGQGLTGLVAKTQKGMIINNALDNPIPSNVPNTNDVEECLISVPLISKTKLVGVATFSRLGSKNFDDEDLQILELLAAQAASVLDNTMLINQLAISERKYYSLINQSALSILILKERMITYCNKRFAEILGLTPEKITNKDITSFIQQKDKSLFASHLTSFLLENQCEDFNITLINQLKKKIIMSFSLSMISWENNQSIMVTALDITEKVELNNQLLQTQKLESVGALASGIAHDFKNILAGITGAADMILMREPEHTGIHNFAQIIKTSADRGTKLSQRLLGYTRKGEVEHHLFNLNDVLNEIIEIVSYTFEKNIEISKHLNDEVLMFEGDPIKIQQCILNLCVNARDAMPQGGVLRIESKRIHSRLLDTEVWPKLQYSQYIMIKVSDTGSGISDELKSRIFEPFFTTKEKGKGTGLGLSTTKSIIDEYNGGIQIESELNKGTTFIIILPVISSDEQIQINKNKEKEKKTLFMKSAQSLDILIVDDEEFVLEVAKELIQEFGNNVFTAQSGFQALEILKKNPGIKLAIIDRMMPKMDGVKLFHELRKYDPNINVVIASGFKNDQEIEILKSEGLTDYITKPYRLEDLNRILSNVSQ